MDIFEKLASIDPWIYKNAFDQDSYAVNKSLHDRKQISEMYSRNKTIGRTGREISSTPGVRNQSVFGGNYGTNRKSDSDLKNQLNNIKEQKQLANKGKEIAKNPHNYMD